MKQQMKKLGITLLALVGCASAAMAQAEDFNSSKIWGKGRYTRLGYVWAQTADDYSPVANSQYAFFAQKGTTFRLHKKPVANMIKFGLDAVWMDVQFSKYKNPYENLPWSDEIKSANGGLSEYIYNEGLTPGFPKNIDFNNLGTMALTMGVGLGPNVSVAPFVLTNCKGLHPLRASAYFHYTPTVALYMKSQEGDIELSTAFMHTFSWGLTLNYRFIALGYECRWGNAKFKPLDFESFVGGEGSEVEKYNRKFANNRLYIQFAF